MDALWTGLLRALARRHGQERSNHGLNTPDVLAVRTTEPMDALGREELEPLLARHIQPERDDLVSMVLAGSSGETESRCEEEHRGGRTTHRLDSSEAPWVEVGHEPHLLLVRARCCPLGDQAHAPRRSNITECPSL